MNLSISKYCVAACAMAVAVPCSGQEYTGLARRNATLRARIETERTDNGYYAGDALVKAARFIRTDSTYYVGYMYEGLYKSDIASDYTGFQQAIPYLLKALDYLERDYAPQLSVRTNNVTQYLLTARYQLDYTQIASALFSCYNNIEEPLNSFMLMQRQKKWNFQIEYYAGAYENIAWLYHRYRMYSPNQFSYLAGSLMGNEEKAGQYLDSAMYKLNRDNDLNNAISPGITAQLYLGIYQYKAMLFMYQFKTDSAQYYYDLLKAGGSYFPHNNYGNFLTVNGDFRAAQQEYNEAATADTGSKYLKEFEYFGSILKIYKGTPDAAVVQLQNLIRESGSVPGWGWYNIALARAYQYEGDLRACQKYTDKAAAFKELHIGTSLGQKQYEFSIEVLRLINIEKHIAAISFEDRHWWWKPAKLWHSCTLWIRKLWQEYIITSKFANDPERELVEYRLFSTECTISWDEIWYLLKDYSTNYFYEKFQSVGTSDSRPRIKKYFRLFEARFAIRKGDYTQALRILNESGGGQEADPEFEKLYAARRDEALARCYYHTGNTAEADKSMSNFYGNFPQLVPFSGLPMPFRIEMDGPGEKMQPWSEALKANNIRWVQDNNVPVVHIADEKNGSISFEVVSPQHVIIIGKTILKYKDVKEGARELAYRLFNINSF